MNHHRRFIPRSSARSTLSCHRLLAAVIAAAMLLSSSGHASSLPSDLGSALGLYRQNKLAEALPQFIALASESQDPAVHVWLAETYRRLGNFPLAYQSAWHALRMDSCNAFAHDVLADVLNPDYSKWPLANDDSTWNHLLRAVKCDSTDGNIWTGMWVASLKRGESTMSRKAIVKQVSTGFLTQTILAFGRWMLRALPTDGVLITNGDMDTFPLLAVQEAEGYRKDVAVVNRSLLKMNWYARYVRRHLSVRLPVDDDSLDLVLRSAKTDSTKESLSDLIIRRWTEETTTGNMDRPLTFAVTVDGKWRKRYADHLEYAGPFYCWVDRAESDGMNVGLATLAMADVDPSQFMGVWASESDRSPIRQVHTKRLAREVIRTAANLCGECEELGDLESATRWLNWAEELDRGCEIGPTFTTEIAILKELLSISSRANR